ncbi:hypothetical protein PGB90_003194 [Kerria lacca]
MNRLFGGGFVLLGKENRRWRMQKEAGRPRDSVMEENMIRIQNLLAEDIRFTLDELCMSMPLDCSRSRIQ